MNILALDLGANCGWALVENGVVTSGVQVFDLKRGESPGMRWLRFDRWLEDVATRADVVIIEAVLGRFAKGQAQTFIASNFAGRVQSFCASRSIEHTDVPGSTLKRFITGKGNAAKPDMRTAAVARGLIPREIADRAGEDEIDARCVLAYALAEIVPASGVGRR